MNWRTNPYYTCAEFRDLSGHLDDVFPGYTFESYPWCIDQVSGPNETCCRFYTLAPPDLLRIRSTLRLTPDKAFLETVPASEPYRWPKDWYELFGSRVVSPDLGKSFVEALEDLGVWQETWMADYVDAALYAVAIARDGKDNCIVMLGPECSPDPRWRAFVNLFSDTFLDGAFSWGPGLNEVGPRSLYRDSGSTPDFGHSSTSVAGNPSLQLQEVGYFRLLRRHHNHFGPVALRDRQG